MGESLRLQAVTSFTTSVNYILFRVYSVRVEQVDIGSPADLCGLEVGDRILRVDGVDLQKCTREQCLQLFQNAELSMTIVIIPCQM